MVIDKTDTFDKVVTIVAEKLNTKKQEIGSASSFQDLGADSLDMYEIILKLEEAFGIEINDEDAENLTNINEVVDYIHLLRTKQ